LAESKELLLEKIKKWKVGMEEKGLRVNVGKTKVMRCQEDAGQAVKTGRYPCGVWQRSWLKLHQMNLMRCMGS